MIVPVCNVSTFMFTGICGWALGERVDRPRWLVAGVVLIVIGVTLISS